MFQNGQTESEGVRLYLDERGIFATKRISVVSKNSSHTESVAEQCARLKRVVEVKFVHSQKHIFF